MKDIPKEQSHELGLIDVSHELHSPWGNYVACMSFTRPGICCLEKQTHLQLAVLCVTVMSVAAISINKIEFNSCIDKAGLSRQSHITVLTRLEAKGLLHYQYLPIKHKSTATIKHSIC